MSEAGGLLGENKDRRSSRDEGVVPRKRTDGAVRQYVFFYFGGLLLAFVMEVVLFLMSYSGFKSTWGLLLMFAIWAVIGIALLVWFSCREDAAHDEQDARLVPLTVSELFLFQEPLRDPSVPEVDAVAHKRHTRRVRHVRICLVVMVATIAGILIGFGACQYFEKYWSYTRPSSDSSSSSSSGAATQHAAWGNVNAETDPSSMPGAKVIYFAADQTMANPAHGGAALSGGTMYCAMPIEFKDAPPSEVNYWAVATGCCSLTGSPRVSCDGSGSLGVVVSGGSYSGAVANALQRSPARVNPKALYVHLVSESGFEREKYTAKVTAWVLFGVLPALWPAGLVIVLLIKLLMDTCGCNTNGHENPDRCKCCS